MDSMQQVTLTVTHNEEIDLKGIPRKFQKRVFQEGGRSLQTQVKKASPVDTGNLRASWELVHNESTTKVVTDTHYADYVDSGTIYIKPRHYTRKAINEFRQKDLPKIIRRAVARSIKK